MLICPYFFSGKTVVELGAGMTALAGLVVAAECNPAKIILTDGNEKSVENIGVILESNPFYCEGRATSRVLKWDQTDLSDMEGTADIVLCSDCLFFDDGRAPLVQCLKRLLKPDGGSSLDLAPNLMLFSDDAVTPGFIESSFKIWG